MILMARNRRIEDSNEDDGQEDLSVGISRFLASSYPKLYCVYTRLITRDECEKKETEGERERAVKGDCCFLSPSIKQTNKRHTLLV